MNEEKMSDFEAALMKALRPVSPPETLAKFLAIAAAAQEQQRRTGRRWFRPWSGGLLLVTSWPRVWAGGALAAVLLFGVVVGEQAHQRHEHAVAEQEFETSLRITNEALEQTRAQLLQAGIQLER
jgi:hypothetical protein